MCSCGHSLWLFCSVSLSFPGMGGCCGLNYVHYGNSFSVSVCLMGQGVVPVQLWTPELLRLSMDHSVNRRFLTIWHL